MRLHEVIFSTNSHLNYENLPKTYKPLAIQIKEHLNELNISTDNIQAEEFKNIARKQIMELWNLKWMETTKTAIQIVS